jgi:hypothetical protein
MNFAAALPPGAQYLRPVHAIQAKIIKPEMFLLYLEFCCYTITRAQKGRTGVKRGNHFEVNLKTQYTK